MKLPLLIFVLIGSLFFNVSVFAVENSNSIKITVQPSSTNSVDGALSQQPVLLVKDANDNPVGGVTVTAVTTGLGELIGSLAEVTNLKGLATFENLGYTGTDSFQIIFGSSAGKAISNPIKLSPGVANSVNSSISVDPLNVVADGISLAVIKITCKDKYKNIIPGASVSVSTSGSDNILSQPDVADDPGITTINLSSTKAESKIITVKVEGALIGKSDPIKFVSGKIAKLSILSESPVDTSHSSEIKITGKDKFDNIVDDSSSHIVLSVDGGGSLNPSVVTLEGGVGKSLLSKKTPGTVNLVASYGNVNDSSRVVFNPADSTAPVVVSQYPLGGAENISLNVIPYINFSKNMDITTINNDNIQLRKYSNDILVPATVIIANGGKQARLQPDSDLSLDTKYYLYVSTDVADPSGNNLPSLYKSDSFATVSGQDKLLLQNNSQVSKNEIAGNSEVENIENNYQISPQDSTADDSNNLTTENNSTNTSLNNTITTKTGGSTENLDNYAAAGLLGAFKNFNVDSFGEWFIVNFIWIISFIIILGIIYIFWFKYVR
ncbi:MAG: invasin domain 3-containing protein [Candidatus Staskawiczbacteria bacterium]|jgi:hypothetical protein